MKSFNQFLLEGKSKNTISKYISHKAIRKFVGSTFATAALGVPLMSAAMDIRDNVRDLMPPPTVPMQMLGFKKKKNPKMTKLQTGLNDFEDDIKINLHTLVDLLDKTGGNAHYRKKS
jgi:hypothetical protein